LTSYIQESALDQKKENKKDVIEDADEACVMMSEDKKFLDDDFIDEFVLDDLINDNKDNEENIESINNEESSNENSK